MGTPSHSTSVCSVGCTCEASSASASSGSSTFTCPCVWRNASSNACTFSCNLQYYIYTPAPSPVSTSSKSFFNGSCSRPQCSGSSRGLLPLHLQCSAALCCQD